MVRVLEKPKKKKSLFLRLAFFVVLLYVAGVLINQQVTISHKRSEYQARTAELEEQKAQNAEIKALNENEDPAAFYEMIARTMNYAYPGEKVFVSIAGN